MACNVFGAPITNETLKGLAEYHDKKELTQEDRSKVAMLMKNAEGKDINAHAFAMKIQERFADRVATMCMIYNATGDAITLERYINKVGKLGEAPFPTVILNGQWGVFVHGKEWDGEDSAVAALVYSGYVMGGKKCYWAISWSNKCGDNKVYSFALNEDGYNKEYKNNDDWYILKAFESNANAFLVDKSNNNGGKIFISIGSNRVSAMEATFMLTDTLLL